MRNEMPSRQWVRRYNIALGREGYTRTAEYHLIHTGIPMYRLGSTAEAAALACNALIKEYRSCHCELCKCREWDKKAF